MPRFQSPTAGASERFGVSPGREELGYFHMPCGQSGHPLSPHYADGHAAWAKGEKTPFLPGPAVQRSDARPGPLTARLFGRRTTMTRRVTVLAAPRSSRRVLAGGAGPAEGSTGPDRPTASS